VSKLERNLRASANGVQIKKELDVEEGEEKRNFLITEKTCTHAGVAKQKKKEREKTLGVTPGVASPAIFMFPDYL